MPRRDRVGRLLAPALLLSCLISPRARALEATLLGEPLRLDVTESAFLSWRGDPGNGDASSANYGETVSRLNLQGTFRQWLFAARLDSSAYFDAPIVGETLAQPFAPEGTKPRAVTAARLQNRFETHPWDPWKGIEKLSLAYQGRRIEATLGDFYAQFGRGLVLSVRKVDELGQDTTILGGKLTLREGPFTATALAGVTNPQNLDETTSRYTEDALDRLTALRSELRLFNKLSIAAQGLFGQPSKNASLAATQPDRYGRYGFSIDSPRPWPWLALYAEWARREDRLSDRENDGSALYGSATIFAGPWTLLAEGKRYDRYEPWRASTDPFRTLVYQQPPTLERVITQMSNNTEIAAGRLRLDRMLSPGRTLYASGEYGRVHPGSEDERDLFDVYSGALLRWGVGGHASPLVGYREERVRATGGLYERLIALEGSVAQPINDRWSLEAQWLVWRRTKEALPDWTEGQAYLSAKLAPHLVLVAGHEFTTTVVEAYNQHRFWNGSAQWNITPSTSLKLFVGGQRPGLKCISGLCRVFPAFNGARLEFVIRG